MLRAVLAGEKTETRRRALRFGPGGGASPSVWNRARPGDRLLAGRTPYGPVFAELELLHARRCPLLPLSLGEVVAEGVRRAGAGWTADPSDPRMARGTAEAAFRALWDAIHPPESPQSWDRNPDVVVLRFRLAGAAEDMAAAADAAVRHCHG